MPVKPPLIHIRRERSEDYDKYFYQLGRGPEKGSFDLDSLIRELKPYRRYRVSYTNVPPRIQKRIWKEALR